MNFKNPNKIVKKFSNFRSARFCIDLMNFLKKIIKEERYGLQLHDGRRPTFIFGRDLKHKEDSKTEFDSVAEIKEDLLKLSLDIKSEIKKQFNDKNDLFLCSIFLASQNPGDKVEIHEDTDGGYNNHFVYSSVFYLNTLDENAGGELVFDELECSIKPKRSDLIFFNTKEGGNHYVENIDQHRYSVCMWFCYDESFHLKII